MSIPKGFVRVTPGGKWQRYQPGFNSGNSCWIEGGWVTVTEAAWFAGRAEWQRLAERVRSEKKTQSHRGEGRRLYQVAEERRNL